jgi:hypothetical protein
MAALVKAPTEGDLLKFDLDKNYTREVVTLLAGTSYKLGSVLGQITASGKYQLSPDTGSDGSQTAAAVLVEAVDATGGDKAGVVIKRGPAIVSRDELVFAASVNDATKAATKIGQLTTLGIVTRATA